MNRITLEQLKNSGPCKCDDPACEYCTLIGDFKFRWYTTNAENAILRNQLERAIEISKGLCEQTTDTVEAVDWCAALELLVHEVRGEFDPYSKITEDAGKI
jgi:hypothetical protein